MRAWIIKSAAEKIEERERALKWLEEYGVNIIGRGDSDQLSITVHMNYAGACVGP